MSSNLFYIKQNDTSPAIRGTVKDGAGNAIDITGASVRFHMRDESGNTVVDASGTVVDGPNGVIQYSWAAADTATVGVFTAEFEVTYGDGSIGTFPNDGYINVIITDDIA